LPAPPALFMASDATDSLILWQCTVGQPLLRLRRLAGCWCVFHEPLEVDARFLQLTEPAVSLGQAEQQLTLWMIAQRAEGRRLKFEHVLVVGDCGFEQRLRPRRG